VELAERFADGITTEAELVASHLAAESEIHPEAYERENPAYWATRADVRGGAEDCLGWCEGLRGPNFVGEYADFRAWQDASEVARRQETAAQADLVRDIFGPLPFRDVRIEPAWLTSDVTALARGIYDEKAFDRMPILADALQDAGCDNDDVLTHCRGAKNEHVRGCWVVDLILGRPWRDV
jgi:hypothetical protein